MKLSTSLVHRLNEQAEGTIDEVVKLVPSQVSKAEWATYIGILLVIYVDWEYKKTAWGYDVCGF